MPRPAPLSYIRRNVQLSGENFVQQWNRLTEQDKVDMKRWAEKEMELLVVEN